MLRYLLKEIGFSPVREPAIELTERVARHAGELARAHALRGADAIHLASALALGDNDVIVAVWDARRPEKVSEGSASRSRRQPERHCCEGKLCCLLATFVCPARVAKRHRGDVVAQSLRATVFRMRRSVDAEWRGQSCRIDSSEPRASRVSAVVVTVAMLCVAFAVLATPAVAVAPSNDLIGNATLVGALPYGLTQSTQDATSSATDPAPSCIAGAEPTVWFRYNETSPWVLRVGISTNASASLVIYSGRAGLTHGACVRWPRAARHYAALYVTQRLPRRRPPVRASA